MGLSLHSLPRQAAESSYRALLRLLQRFDDPSDARHLQLVRGWRHADRATVIARVVTSPVRAEPERLDDRAEYWATLRERYFRLGATGALAQLEVGRHTFTVRADRDGFLEVTVPHVDDATPRLRVQRGPEATPAVEVPLVGPYPDARYAVVSDIDDTVIETERDGTLERARAMLLSDATARVPFPGLARFYGELHDRGTNPFFYLSNSPWNLYEHLDTLLGEHDLPAGPILLRRVTSRRDAHRHKHRWLDRLLIDLNPLPFVLLGDTTRHDGAVYVDMAERWPGRVEAIFLRTFDGEPVPREVRRRAEELGVPLIDHRDMAEARAGAEAWGLL